MAKTDIAIALPTQEFMSVDSTCQKLKLNTGSGRLSEAENLGEDLFYVPISYEINCIPISVEKTVTEKLECPQTREQTRDQKINQACGQPKPAKWKKVLQSGVVAMHEKLVCGKTCVG